MTEEKKPEQPKGGPTGVKGGVAALPDHIGASKKAPPPPAPPEAKSKVIQLGPIEGSGLHVIQLTVQLILKEMDKATLRSQLHDTQKKLADAELKLLMNKLGDEQKKMQELMTKLSVPDGLSINRVENGSYVLAPPPPQAQAR